MERDHHTLDGFLLCGGYGHEDDPDNSCEEFSPVTGHWARTNHTLHAGRGDHVSWSVEPEGTMLMGGFWSEIVKHDGNTETSFDLNYDTT